MWAVVDEIDYHYLVRWCWTPQTSTKEHFIPYLRRAGHAPWNNGGMVAFNRSRPSILLHRAVLKRAQPIPPSPLHRYADHIDRDFLNCRRANLRWVTRSQNNSNRKPVSEWRAFKLNGGYVRETTPELMREPVHEVKRDPVA